MLAARYRASFAVVVCVAGVSLYRLRTRPTPVSAAPSPQLAEQPQAALPPRREVATLPPAPLGTRCPIDVATIGTSAAAALPYPDEVLAGASIDPASCLVAAWTERALHVSWDAGHSFAAFDTKTSIRSVSTLGDRVVVVLDGQLGVLHRGDTAIPWRSLARFVEGNAHVPVHVTEQRLAVSSSRELAVSDDDGATWRTLEPPAASDRWAAGLLHSVDDDGAIVARQFASRSWLDAHPVPVTHDADEDVKLDDRGYERWLVTRIDDGTWRELAGPPNMQPTRSASGWSYAFEDDESWGCGGSIKLVASHGERRVTLVGDQRPDVWDVGLIAGARATFVQYHEHGPRLARLAGTKRTPIAVPSEWWVKLVGVDRYDTPIVLANGHLLRWSEAGGWRVLLAARPAISK